VELREALAGGERITFSIEVPAGHAARLALRQDGADVIVTLRRAGSDVPRYGLDMVGGPAGEELVLPPVLEEPATWTVLVRSILPRAARADFTASLELAPADERSRAIAEARRLYQAAAVTSTSPGYTGETRVQARDQYAAAADAARAAGDEVLAAEATYQCARIIDQLGDIPSAVEWQRRALSMFQALGRKDRQARVLNRLGDLSRKLGDVTESERYFAEALPLAQETHDLAAVADILNNSGLLKLKTGRFEEALDQLQAAIPLAQELESADVEGALTLNSGEAYASLGEHEKSIEARRRSLEVVSRINSPRRTGRALYALASAYFENGDDAKAYETIRNALSTLEQSGDRAYEAEARGFLAHMLHRTGESEQAVQAFARAAPMLREAQNRLGEARVLSSWAELEIDRGETEAALVKLEQSLQLARQAANPQTEARALYLKALALEKQGRLDEAIQSVGGAVASVEAMRGSIVRSEFRTSYLAAVRSYFDLHVDLLARRGSASAAFEMSERGRARTLLEGLAESASKIKKGVDPALLARQRALQAQLNAKESLRAQVALANGEKSARALALGREIELLLGQWKDIEAQIRAASPAYWALSRPEPVSAARVQGALLDEGTALVEYYLGSKRGHAWVIDRRGVTSHVLPAAATVGRLARRYHELLSRERELLDAGARAKLGEQVAEAGRSLAAMVWQPVEQRVRGKRLLIVADGALQYVPFAALPTTSGEPLLSAHELAYLPSASVLDTLRRDNRRVASNATAVFADPVFTRDDPRVVGGERPAAAGSASTSRAAAAAGFPRLRFSRKEAETIAAAAGAPTFEALDFSASKKTLLERDLRRYRILHFATHGVLDTERPELSGLVFSLVDQAGKPVDGFLRLHEIYNLDLDAELVVLSACRTALGKEVHGEGLIGLTRGFLYAGASRIVSSVWNVDDRASALLMSRFYTAMLAKGLAPAAALRHAQLSMLQEARWSNPHYWAAFGLQGEWK
jgi:CHAT domain-containing protein/Tfp pilus assembly protein PilF